MSWFFYSASQTVGFPVAKCMMQEQSITCDLLPFPTILSLEEQLTDTEKGNIKKTEWEYSSQSNFASFTSDVSQVKK